MKLVILSLFFISSAFASTPDISKAPFEWLVAQTLMEKMNEENHFDKDELVKEIFETIKYNEELDELILSSTRQTHLLRGKLVYFVKKAESRRKIDPSQRIMSTSPVATAL